MTSAIRPCACAPGAAAPSATHRQRGQRGDAEQPADRTGASSPKLRLPCPCDVLRAAPPDLSAARGRLFNRTTARRRVRRRRGTMRSNAGAGLGYTTADSSESEVRAAANGDGGQLGPDDSRGTREPAHCFHERLRGNPLRVNEKRLSLAVFALFAIALVVEVAWLRAARRLRQPPERHAAARGEPIARAGSRHRDARRRRSQHRHPGRRGRPLAVAARGVRRGRPRDRRAEARGRRVRHGVRRPRPGAPAERRGDEPAARRADQRLHRDAAPRSGRRSVRHLAARAGALCGPRSRPRIPMRRPTCSCRARCSPDVWRLGAINFLADSDGVGRRYPLVIDVHGWPLPSMGARVARDSATRCPRAATSS